MNIPAQLVSKLREKTGAGMMECKKALVECDGDFEKATDLLRVRGKAGAEKRAARAAAEGVATATVRGNVAAMIEINSETDFVARNDEFREAAEIAVVLAALMGIEDVEVLRQQTIPEAVGRHVGEKLGDVLEDMTSRMRENIVLRRAAVLKAEEGELVNAYIHTVTNKIAVLVKLRGDASNSDHATLARNIAMHIAASKPDYIRREDVPEEVLQRERQVLADKTRAEGKPEAAIPKIVEGRLSKFYEQVCLLDQPYVREPSQKVSAVLQDAGADVVAFRMFAVGQE